MRPPMTIRSAPSAGSGQKVREELAKPVQGQHGHAGTEAGRSDELERVKNNEHNHHETPFFLAFRTIMGWEQMQTV